MARIRFVDEMNTEGELALDAVRPGDLVRFNADFVKRAPEAGGGEGEGDESEVSAGDVGEVLDVFPQMPGLLVECPFRKALEAGAFEVADAEAVVDPRDLTMLVDSRDPRLGSHRITVVTARDTSDCDVITVVSARDACRQS